MVLSCEWCARLVDERYLDADGICPACADPDMTEFNRDVEAYTQTYQPDYQRESSAPDVDTAHAHACPRCGQAADRLLGVTHSSGVTRAVCQDCVSDARSGDRSFWNWFHHE